MIWLGGIITLAIGGGAAVVAIREAAESGPKIWDALCGRGGWWL